MLNPPDTITTIARRAVAAIRLKGYLDEGLLEHPQVDEAETLDHIETVIASVLRESDLYLAGLEDAAALWLMLAAILVAVLSLK